MSDRHSIEYVTLASEASGRPIQVRVERSREASPGAPHVVVQHGFKGFMHWGFFPELSRRIAEAGFVAVSLNGSCNGVSASPTDAEPAWEEIDDDEAFASNTHSIEVADLGAVRAWARRHVGGPAGLFGHSRGGGVALLSAAAHAPGALVTWASIDDVDRVDEEAKAIWRETGVLDVPNARTGQVHHLGLVVLEDVERNRDALDVLAASKRVDVPALVVHGTDDPAVDFSCAERIVEALPRAELLRIEGGNHVFGATHPLRTEAPLAPDLERALAATVAHFAAHLAAR